MTFKSAVADGLGESVVIGDPATAKSEALFRAMGRFIDAVGGKYITAQDMNIGNPDLEVVAQETRWVTGLDRDQGLGQPPRRRLAASSGSRPPPGGLRGPLGSGRS